MRRSAAAALALLALGGWTSCRRVVPAESPVPCASTAGALADGGRADGLAGEWRLTLVATSGARSGASASGRLTLRPFPGDMRPVEPAPGYRFSLHGSAALPLDSVGAVAPGDITRLDPARPGVLAMEWRRTSPPPPADQITLRFGADANRRGPDRFDGAHLTLSLAASAEDSFAGVWESAGGDVQAGGYFCARRV